MKIDALLTLHGRYAQPSARVNAGSEGGSSSGLQAGQLLKARIVGLDQAGRYLLDANGRTLVAESRVPLEIGRKLWLEVRLSGNSIFLSQSKQQEAVQELLKFLARDGAGVSGTISSIIRLSGSIFNQKGDSLSPQLLTLLRDLASLAVVKNADLANLVELFLLFGKTGHRGQANETIRPDLTLLLTDLLKSFAEKGQPAVAAEKMVEGGLEKLLSLLESCKLINRTGSGQPDFVLQPCFFGLEGGWGTWIYSVAGQGGSGQSKERGQSLRFFLQMSNLGQICLMIRIEGKRLQGTLFFDNQRVVEFMEARIPKLEVRLAGLGYGPLQLTCQRAPRSFLQEFKEQLELHGDLPSIALLDIKV